MNLSPTHQARFDALLVAPLESNRKVKRGLEAFVKGLPDSEQRRVAQGALDLVDCLERKTSPLYVRLTHACAAFVQEVADPAPCLEVVNSVARQCKRFERVLPE
ncbi:MAG: hypothetical protein VX899_13555 [Myxococcota bacterium]|nr:hypothetical protein [Myxococcota bacterium]